MADAAVSVVMPAWNRAALLPRAVRSALSQSYPVSEVIVVDDGSTDDTERVLRELSAEDARVKALVQPRGGANAARNTGIAASSGEWVAFLDSDDEWDERKLEKQMRAVAANPEAVAAFSGLRHAGGTSTRVFIPPANPSLDLLRGANVLSSTSSALVRRDVLEAVGAFDVRLPSCQDWDLWFRLRQQGPFEVVQEPLLIFHSEAPNRITADGRKVIEGHEILFSKLTEDIKTDPKQLRPVRALHQLVLSDIYYRSGRHREAVRLALSSLAARPSSGVRGWRSLRRLRWYKASAVGRSRMSNSNASRSGPDAVGFPPTQDDARSQCNFAPSQICIAIFLFPCIDCPLP